MSLTQRVGFLELPVHLAVCVSDRRVCVTDAQRRLPMLLLPLVADFARARAPSSISLPPPLTH